MNSHLLVAITSRRPFDEQAHQLVINVFLLVAFLVWTWMSEEFLYVPINNSQCLTTPSLFTWYIVRVFKDYKFWYYSSSSKRVRKFLDIANQEIYLGFIVSWESIVINPIATTCGGEYLSKDSEVIRTLKPQQYSSSWSSSTPIFLTIMARLSASVALLLEGLCSETMLHVLWVT